MEQNTNSAKGGGFLLALLVIITLISIYFFTVWSIDYSHENGENIYEESELVKPVLFGLGLLYTVISLYILKPTQGIGTWKDNFTINRVRMWGILFAGVMMIIISLSTSRVSIILDTNGFTYTRNTIFTNNNYEIIFKDTFSIDIDSASSSVRDGATSIIVRTHNGRDIKLRANDILFAALPNIIRFARNSDVDINDNR